jgi:AcrR family transcriptional regulator
MVADGLMACLREKTLAKVRIADITGAAGVGRATFYRLFDGVDDVLRWRCDAVFADIVAGIGEHEIRDAGDVLIFFTRSWLAQPELLRALADSNMLDVLYESHMAHASLVRAVFARDLPEGDLDCVCSLLAGAMVSVLRSWYAAGTTDSAEQVCGRARRCLAAIGRAVG